MAVGIALGGIIHWLREPAQVWEILVLIGVWASVLVRPVRRLLQAFKWW